MSRELDALVEKHIFGKDPRCYDCPHFDEKGRMLSFCNCPPMPHRSASIEEAFGVVFKMMGKGYDFTFAMDGRVLPGEAIANFWFDKEMFMASGPVAAAICIAALAAVGIDAEAELKGGAR